MKEKSLILILIVLCLQGCAPSVSVKNMVPIIDTASLHHSQRTLIVGDVVGGETSYATSFKNALIISIENSGLFDNLGEDQVSDYILKAVLFNRDQPIAGLDMTVTLIVKYFLIDNSTKMDIWTKDIYSTYTQVFNSSCIGAKRLNSANEGVVRENIKILLDELSKLNL